MAGIEALKHAFREGIDIHAMTASQVFGVPLDQMTGEIRRKAKAINFGIIYGISGFGLGRQLGISAGEANAFIKKYLERFPELAAYMDRTKEFCRRNGYVTTLFGRRCHIQGIAEKNPARRQFAERQAINAPIQGTAADIIKRAMIRIPPALAEPGFTAACCSRSTTNWCWRCRRRKRRKPPIWSAGRWKRRPAWAFRWSRKPERAIAGRRRTERRFGPESPTCMLVDVGLKRLDLRIDPVSASAFPDRGHP